MDTLSNLSDSKTHYFFTILSTLILCTFFFFFSTSDDASPAISSLSLSGDLPPPPIKLPLVFPGARFASKRVSRYGADSGPEEEIMDSCDVFDGRWVVDQDLDPFYRPGSCPFVDDAFNCFKNGRPDSDYLKLKWKPHACEIPRFNGLKMLKMLRGKRMVFVGDSLNRNMWESLVCSLRESLVDKTKVFEVSDRRFYSFKFKDFNCSIDFIKSPFLVQEWRFSDKAGTRRETLRLDMMEGSYDKYHDADFIVFNTGHWWTHQKTFKGKNYFQEGDHVYTKLEVAEAYRRALKTWAHWVDSNIDSTRTTVFFRGYSASHFKGGQWNSGGSCDGETEPIKDEAHLSPYPWMMRVLESVLSKMKTKVIYLNVTRMTDYRKDGHPSVFRQVGAMERGGFQDCSHWCLPGVPDSWNEVLYAVLVRNQKKFGGN